MAKIILTIIAIIGAAYILGAVWPGSVNTLTTIGGLGITWIMLGSLGVGAFTYSRVK